MGTKFSFEKEHEAWIDEARRKHEPELLEFRAYLMDNPMLGAQHPTGRRIIRVLQKSQRVPLANPFWFRARENKEHGIGMAPRERVADQRYNSSGQARWYFADGAEAAVAEACTKTTGRNAWVAKFNLGPLDSLLDLRPWTAEDDRALDEEGNYRSPHNPLLVALIAEQFFLRDRAVSETTDSPNGDRQRPWKPEYLIPRFVADSARNAGFRGILYRSVRHWGTNLVLVVFDAEWTPSQMEEPYLLEIPDSRSFVEFGMW